MKVVSTSFAFALLTAGMAAPAQPAAGRDASVAADPLVPVPHLRYESPFARYRVFTDGAAGSWKAVNDEVGRIGGWKVYAREAYEAASPAVPAAGPAEPGGPATAHSPEVPARLR